MGSNNVTKSHIPSTSVRWGYLPRARTISGRKYAAAELGPRTTRHQSIWDTSHTTNLWYAEKNHGPDIRKSGFKASVHRLFTTCHGRDTTWASVANEWERGLYATRQVGRNIYRDLTHNKHSITGIVIVFFSSSTTLGENGPCQSSLT